MATNEFRYWPFFRRFAFYLLTLVSISNYAICASQTVFAKTLTSPSISNPVDFLNSCIENTNVDTSSLPPVVRRPYDLLHQAHVASQLAVDPSTIISSKQPYFSRNPDNDGLLVCDPVVYCSNSFVLSDFAAGCGRWLDLVVAGRPQLGRTPPWADRNRIEQELNRRDLFLRVSDCDQLPSIAGVNVVARGSLGVKPNSQYTLTYYLFSVPDNRIVSQPITFSGTENSIVDALPDLALQLESALNIHPDFSIRLPKITPYELSFLGAAADDTTHSLLSLPELSKLSEKDPLAGMLLLQSPGAEYDQVILDRSVKFLLASLPDNALVHELVATTFLYELYPDLAGDDGLFRKYPQSSLLAEAQSREDSRWGSRTNELTTSQRALCDNPFSPALWVNASQVLNEICDDIRQSRQADQLSVSQLEAIFSLYSKIENEANIASQLDPRDGQAWLKLSESATYANDIPQAYLGYQKAELNSFDTEGVDRLGLQLYQAKFGSNSPELMKIAQRAATRTYSDYGSLLNIVPAMYELARNARDANYSATVGAMVSQFISEQRSAISIDSSDGRAYWNIANALSNDGNMVDAQEALQYYKDALILLPRSSQLHIDRANLEISLGKTNDEIADMRQAVQISPLSDTSHYDFASALCFAKKYDQALKEANIVGRLNPSLSSTAGLFGDIELHKSKTADAIIAFSLAALNDSDDPQVWLKLSDALYSAGRFRECIMAGAEAQSVIAKYGNATANEIEQNYYDMASAYFRLSEWAKSKEFTEYALRLNPSDKKAKVLLALSNASHGNNYVFPNYSFIVSIPVRKLPIKHEHTHRHQRRHHRS